MTNDPFAKKKTNGSKMILYFIDKDRVSYEIITMYPKYVKEWKKH